MRSTFHPSPAIGTANGRRPARARGFTLVELMFTLTIAALLLGIAVPSFRSMVLNNRLASQTNEIISAINMARSEALTRNTAITLCRAADENATDCTTDDGSWAAWMIINPAGDVLRTGVFNDYGGTITINADLDSESVTFQPDGLARTGAGFVVNRTIVVCSSQATTDNIRTITLGAGSRVSSVKSKGACS